MEKDNKPLTAYIISLIILFAIICIAYFIRFKFNFNAPIEDWISTASFFNSILTPPLLAITSILIFLTWQTSKNQLKHANEMMNSELNLKIFNNMLESTTTYMDSRILRNDVVKATQLTYEKLEQNHKYILDNCFGCEMGAKTLERKVKRYCRFKVSEQNFRNEDIILKVGKGGLSPTPKEDLDSLVLIYMERALVDIFSGSTDTTPLIIHKIIRLFDFIGKEKESGNDLIADSLIDSVEFGFREEVLESFSHIKNIKEHHVFTLMNRS
ncbi:MULTISPECIES: hypothetical protein [unclassified Pseudoalteromonas]|uniref:hypothetical protein n=1 Tax=unclassified Pseudoalteromonas TaxID=194690 RepID=UPI00051A1787|nr:MULTISPECIES: hypothetical protein [unclassified Pseudoalteromonas]KGJ96579.1 hypothetical protein ND6B_3773 [Pseudoalteromonas sp. ND6B]MDN3407067.1 hypothetical protein [Pseudoalteromonas sp. APC 3218]